MAHAERTVLLEDDSGSIKIACVASNQERYLVADLVKAASGTETAELVP